jgi:hypothetical protein
MRCRQIVLGAPHDLWYTQPKELGAGYLASDAAR